MPSPKHTLEFRTEISQEYIDKSGKIWYNTVNRICQVQAHRTGGVSYDGCYENGREKTENL